MELTEAQPLLPRPAPRPTPEGSDGRAAATTDFNSFLNLLTAQLRFQDPLQPIDSTQFVAQLASFSTVEQLIGSNEKLDSLLAQSESSTVGSYAGWIGREVARPDGRARATGEPLQFGVRPEGGSVASTARVMRADGTVLRELPVPPGETELVWDGLTTDGTSVAGEDVSIIVEHVDAEGETTRAAAEIWVGVTGLRGGPDGAELLLADGSRLDPGTVSGLRAPLSDTEEEG